MAHEFFRLLEREHEEVSEVLDQLENAAEAPGRKKDQLFTQLKQTLVPHLRGEEEHFYPVLLENTSTRALAMESIEEHRAAEMALADLEKSEKSADGWVAKLKACKQALMHHIEEEEEELFDAAEDALNEEQLDDIMTAFREGREKLKSK